MRPVGMTRVLVLAGMALAGCSQEVRLEGERLPVTAALEAEQPLDGRASDSTAPRAVAIALPGLSAGDWPQLGGNARHDMPHGQLSAAPGLVFASKIGQGDGRRQRVFADPVAAGGRIFVMDAEAMVSAVGKDGSLLWQSSARGEFDRDGAIPGGGLAVDSGTVLATTGFGEVVALDAASGAVRWRQRFDAPINGAPLIEGGTAYVATRAAEIAAVDLANGKLRWSNVATPGLRGMLRGSAPASSGAQILFPSASGEILAVAAADGAGAWRAAVSGQDGGLAAAQFSDVTGSPVVKGGTVFAGSAGGRLVAVSAADGLRQWTAGEGSLGTPLAVGGSVFVVNQREELVRLDAGDGSVVWRSALPGFVKDKPARRKATTAHFGPVLAGGRIVIASSDGALRLFDPRSGALVGQVAMPDGAASAPILAGGTLYVLSEAGQLLAFR